MVLRRPGKIPGLGAGRFGLTLDASTSGQSGRAYCLKESTVKALRILLKTVVALFVLLLIAAVALVFLFDPNMFKPRLEAAARDQGVELRIDGNLGWQLWPALGVEVNGIYVAALETPDEAIAELDKASLRLAIRPLFRGELEVHHLVLDGARLDLRVDESGQGNWEKLLPDDEGVEPAPEPEVAEAEEGEAEEGEALRLAVQRISLRNAALRYRDAGTGQSFDLSSLNLDLNDFNLQGDPFGLELDWRISIDDAELFDTRPLDVAGTLRSRFRMATDMSELRLSDGRLSVDLERAGASGTIGLTFSLDARDLLEAPNYQGEVRLASFNPRALMAVLSLPELDMESPDALTRLAFNTRLRGDTEQLTLDPLTIELDSTRIEGRFAVTDLSRNAIELVLRGDRINIDHYLPPATEEEVETPEATGDEELIPLEAVRELAAEVSLDFQQLQAMGLTFTDLSLRLSANGGLIQLTRARLNAYEGELNATGQLDGRGDTAVIDFASNLDGFQVAPLLRDLELDENLQLSGALNAKADGGTRGVTMNQLMDALKAQAEFSGAQVRMAPLNIEERFCQLVNLANRRDGSGIDWPEYTEMRQLAGRATIADQVLKVESFEAGVSEITLNLLGNLNLKQETYDFTLPMRLGSQSTSAQGCRIQSNYWVDRSLALLRCRGSLTDLNPLSDCGFDRRGVESLVTEFATYQLEQRYGERLDEEKAQARQRLQDEEDRARERVDREQREQEERARERLKEEEDKVEERLRGLLRR